MDEALFHLRIRIRDPKFFVARLLLQLSQQTGFHPDVVAEVLVAFTALALIAWRHAYFLANSILIVYPLLVTYIFVEERPSRDDLLLYWASFSILTLLDRVLESIFAYYVLKVALLAMLFLEPFRFVDKVKRMLHQTISSHLDNWGKSPRPAKPEEDEAAHALAVQMKGAIEKDVNQTDSIMALKRTDSQHSNVHYRLGASSTVTAPSSTTRTDKFWMAPATKMRASEIRLNGSDLLTARSMSPNSSSMRMGSTQDVNSERQQISERSAQLPSAVTCKEAIIEKEEVKTPPKQEVTNEESKTATPSPPPPPPPQTIEEIPTKTPPLLSPRTADMTAIEKIETSTPPNEAVRSESEVSQGEKTMPGISLRTEKSDSQVSLQEAKEPKPVPTSSAPEVIKTAVSPSPVAVTPPVAPASDARASRSDSSVKSEYVSLTPVHTAREPVTPVRTARDSSPQRIAERTTSVTDIPSKKRFRGRNPMSVDSSYRLSSSRSEDNIHREIGPPPNLNDLIFYPTNKIVFNAPFDFDNITYHMQMWNKSRHNIAFAVKGNCVPRVTAYPPCGIIESNHKIFVAVTVKKFDFNDTDFNKDRIVFEYVLLKDSQKNEKAFSHRLLQDAEVRRRKNIYISYNP